jgi:3D (Asp-Asp-Asp) domain-containing protein
MKRTLRFVIAIAIISGFGLFSFVNTAGADLKTPHKQPTPKAAKVFTMRITAYTSDPAETSNHPLITASGEFVHDGVVASNILPFGTKIKIPSLFGDQVFTVEDRMNQRFQNTVDIWMHTKRAALRFGVSYVPVVVLGNEPTSTATYAYAGTKNGNMP